jgi:O-acetyl-ADP-ribose deacetylase
MTDAGGTHHGAAQFGPITVDIAKGDITDQPEFDAIVNAANAQLLPGAGVAGAIHRAAGPELAAEGRPLAPIRTGECVITSGHRLANPFVIHCLGPVYATDDDPSGHLASCHRRALELAEARGIDSVCFPALSTGVFGYPIDEAADVAIRTIADCAPTLTAVRRVRFVLFDDDAYEVFADTLRRAEREHAEGAS